MSQISQKSIINQLIIQQAEKLNSREMKEGWMKNDEWRMIKDEGWMMKDDDFKLLKGFALWQTNERTNEQTFAIVESLSRLKKCYIFKASQL